MNDRVSIPIRARTPFTMLQTAATPIIHRRFAWFAVAHIVCRSFGGTFALHRCIFNNKRIKSQSHAVSEFQSSRRVFAAFVFEDPESTNRLTTENSKNRSRYREHVTRSPGRAIRANLNDIVHAGLWDGDKGGAINTAINRHYKSLALLPSVSIAGYNDIQVWILTKDEDDNEEEEEEEAKDMRWTRTGRRKPKVEQTSPLRVGRGMDARMRFHIRG